NRGTLRGRSLEMVEELQRRMVDVAALQEIRWKGEGTRFVGAKGGRYNWYLGAERVKNGVGIFVRKPLAQEVLDIKRINSRLMWIKFRIEKQTMIIFSAYAPQTGKSKEMKNNFWTAFSDTISTIPKSESILIGGDLNGHVGEKTDGLVNVHGGFGYGDRNEDVIPGESCVAQHRLLVAELVVELSNISLNKCLGESNRGS
ncbi:hypothetical protein HELRODRAFT_81208, partial [Helobdella robusta]|uniref:Endonuclease/exonuclease/phosphatase domain-containing protein n=1 Tax=Helobdella robusta TaxID=6412 RepID=T1G4B3_HELRO